MGAVAYDKAVAESLFATFEKDLVHRHTRPTRDGARLAIFDYAESFYNSRRRHSTLSQLSPAAFEEMRDAVTVQPEVSTRAVQLRFWRERLMRKWILALAALSMLAATCAPQEYDPQTPTEHENAADCLQVNHDNLYTTGGYAPRNLTVATGDPAFPPWWEGGTTDEHPEWRSNDPYLGQGYEGAVTFEVAERLGFSEDRVVFVPIGFEESFAPGVKDFDFVLQQISYLPERAEGVDFSESYYDVNQALVSVRGSQIADATSLEELKDATLGAPIGTTSLSYIEDNIQPSMQPVVYDDLGAAVQGLKNGRVDGIVVDLPSASFITAVQIPESVIVGRFPTVDSQEYFAMAFEKGSPLVECVNLALQEMKDDGALEKIRQEWLADKADAPMLEG
jgi:polar amino acid transport system substrate-binding protein